MLKSFTMGSIQVVSDYSIDYRRPIRVIVIGAGISGIISTIRIAQRIPNAEIQIYEKNTDIGGTWFENTYPGVAWWVFYLYS